MKHHIAPMKRKIHTSSKVPLFLANLRKFKLADCPDPDSPNNGVVVESRYMERSMRKELRMHIRRQHNS